MEKKVVIETSGRHVHLARKELDILFGEGHQLTSIKELSQPGQFACKERVDIIGPRGELKNLIIIGPERAATQVEISRTDSRTLGVEGVIKESASLEGTPGCKIVGPNGTVELERGVLVAKRHIHITPEKASEYDVVDGEIVMVKIPTEVRGLILDDVVVRVNADYALAMHIDTDESNAAGISGPIEGIIIKK